MQINFKLRFTVELNYPSIYVKKFLSPLLLSTKINSTEINCKENYRSGLIWRAWFLYRYFDNLIKNNRSLALVNRNEVRDSPFICRPQEAGSESDDKNPSPRETWEYCRFNTLKASPARFNQWKHICTKNTEYEKHYYQIFIISIFINSDNIINDRRADIEDINTILRTSRIGNFIFLFLDNCSHSKLCRPKSDSLILALVNVT